MKPDDGGGVPEILWRDRFLACTRFKSLNDARGDFDPDDLLERAFFDSVVIWFIPTGDVRRRIHEWPGIDLDTAQQEDCTIVAVNSLTGTWRREWTVLIWGLEYRYDLDLT